MPDTTTPAALHVPESVRSATSLPGYIVWSALADRTALTIEEILAHTGICRRAATGALADLRKAGLIEADTHPVDGRRKLYRTTDSVGDAVATSTPASP